MKIIDCYWELKNLGEKTAEVMVEKKDSFQRDVFEDVNHKFSYVVVKVPMNMMGFNFGLSSMGFTMIETQINISKRYKKFNFEDRLVKVVYSHLNTKRVTSKEELEEVICQITPDMFSTDRIYLDPYFPHDASSKRYINWMRSDFESGNAIIDKTYYDDKNVGFGFTRFDENRVSHGVLGGIYEKYQDIGLGIVNAALPFIMTKKKNYQLEVYRTSISSNNPFVWQFYNYLGYKIDSMTYVFVKHNNI